MLKAQNKQVKRRKLIGKETLIIGVDIGKNFNACVLMDKKDNILKKLSKIHNNYGGYEWMMRQIKDTVRAHRFQKLPMGLELKSHYWRKLSYMARSEQIGPYHLVGVKARVLKAWSTSAASCRLA